MMYIAMPNAPYSNRCTQAENDDRQTYKIRTNNGIDFFSCRDNHIRTVSKTGIIQVFESLTKLEIEKCKDVIKETFVD